MIDRIFVGVWTAGGATTVDLALMRRRHRP